jgi:hypothetical protein
LVAAFALVALLAVLVVMLSRRLAVAQRKG